jgi:hypothetical protein
VILARDGRPQLPEDAPAYGFVNAFQTTPGVGPGGSG